MLLQMVLCIFNKHGQAELAARECGEGELAAGRASGWRAAGTHPAPRAWGRGLGWRCGPWGPWEGGGRGHGATGPFPSPRGGRKGDMSVSTCAPPRGGFQNDNPPPPRRPETLLIHHVFY